MKRQRIIYYISALLILAVMIGTAEITGEKEIIFPEITAIAVGALIAPKQSWNFSPLRIFITVSAMAICGVLIVRYIPLPKYFTLPIGFAVSILSLLISKCGFVPQISACVLPIVLSTNSFIYPVSVVIMTALILLVQFLLFKLGRYQYRKYEPVPITKARVIYFAKQILTVSLIFLLPAITGQMFFVVPPLIVGYLEMCEKGSRVGENRKKAVLLIFFAATFGTVSRMVLAEYIGIPLTISAVFACILIFILISKTKLYFPPCAAICTLPMLLSAENLWLYPIEVTAGFCVMCLISLLYNKPQRAEN